MADDTELIAANGGRMDTGAAFTADAKNLPFRLIQSGAPTARPA